MTNEGSELSTRIHRNTIVGALGANMPVRLYDLERKAFSALAQVSDHLEDLAKKSVLELSRKHPGKKVTFCSAMGMWSFSVDDESYGDSSTEKLDETFSRVLGNLHWNAIPAPVRMTVVDGEFELLRDW